MNTLIRLFLITLLAFSGNALASDLAKEKRWADQVVDAILDGEAIWLNDGSNEFLGIFTEAEEDQGRAVIVMHGTGVHPDWQQVVQPLRVGLIEHHWNTLSIQMPILPNEAEYAEYAPLYDEVAPRINAAIDYLHKNGSKEIVLIGHSQGAAMAAYYLSITKRSVNGFVAIAMTSLADDARMNVVNSLKKITVPVLDIYGEDDREDILKSVDARAGAAKQAGNKNYTQVKVAGSNHFFDGKEDDLVEAVADWLDKSPDR